MVMPSNKVIINIDDQEIELKGQELTDFLAQREAENQEKEQLYDYSRTI